MNAMGKVRCVLLVWVVVILCFTGSNGENEEEEEHKKEGFSLWEWQRLREAYNIHSSAFSIKSVVPKYWGLLKALVHHAYLRLFPPNIDFRSGDEMEGGSGEKVKEALANSLGTSKSTMEETAKSAADIAGRTMHKAKEKVKKTLSSSSSSSSQRQNEL